MDGNAMPLIDRVLVMLIFTIPIWLHSVNLDF